MPLLVANNLRKSFGSLDVLMGVNATLSAGEKVGLVGPNGQGKTTLLRLLLGRQEPTEGSVDRVSGIRMGYLPQDPPAPRDLTLWDAMIQAVAEITRLEEQMAELQHRLAERPDDSRLVEQFGRVQLRFETLGGYSYRTRLEMLLEHLRFPREMFDQPLSQLSGGQRSRAMLAELLARDPDVLMLDEPTNHLDMETVEWLESYLKSAHPAMIVVSHDRYFLDRLVGKTWEISFGKLEAFKGNYSAYVQKRRERFEQRMRQWEAQQDYIARTEEFIRRNLAGQRTKEAQGRRSRLERFLAEEAIEKPREHHGIDLEFHPARTTGRKVLELRELAVGYSADAPLAQAERLEVSRGERIAILGPNGSGKTTLLRTLMGSLDPLVGQVRFGANVEKGYLSQTHGELVGEDDLMTSVLRAEPGLRTEDVRNLLGSLHFSGDDASKKVSELSGGQRSRVVLARLMATRANVLLLDEPTNHLDLPSCETLQEALRSFDGTVLMVSHDRYLIEAVATRIWVLVDGEIRDIPGSWEAYVRWRQRRDEAADAADAAPTGKSAGRAEGKAAYEAGKQAQRRREKLKRDHARIEEAIHELEEQLGQLTTSINAASELGDMEQVEELGREYAGIDEQLQEQWRKWEQVGEEMEQADEQVRGGDGR
jgi:ATP-binding cassette subfamily F protein 3